MTSPGEFTANNPVLRDIDGMFEQGIFPYLASFNSLDDANFRLRLAYDRSWQEIWDVTFGGEPNEIADPKTMLITAFERAWTMRDDPIANKYATFASTCHWTRSETNEIKMLFDDNKTYPYETRFKEKIQDLCVAGDIRGDRFENPQHTALFMINYLTLSFVTWSFDKGITVEEAQYGLKQAIFGSGPSQYS